MIPVSLLVECAEGVREGARQSMGNATCPECATVPTCECGRSMMLMRLPEAATDIMGQYIHVCPACEPEWWE